MQNRAKKTAYLGVFCAAAMILGYVELNIPVFAAVPGMKLGLPNLAVLMALYLYSWREALFVSMVRIVGIGLLFGNLFSIAFSLSGGLFSLLCMVLAKRSGLLSCTGVSMLGGIAHNAGQIAIAILIVENIRIAWYFVPLVITGLVSGIVIGLLGGWLVHRLERFAPKV